MTHDDDEDSSSRSTNNDSRGGRTDFFVPLHGAIATLKRSIHLYLKSGTVRTFIKLALFFVIPATAILLSVVYTIMNHHGSSSSHDDDNNSMSKLFWKYVTILMSQSLLQTTLGAITEGAIAVAVADLYLQRHPSWLTCLQKATKKAFTLLLAGFVAGLTILLGYWCFYVPGLLLKLNFALVTPVIILEDELSALAALGRSWDLVKGRRFYVLKCLIGLDSLYWITNWVLKGILSCFVTWEDTNPFFSLTFHFLRIFPATMIVPLLGILKTVMYINLLVIKENIDEQSFAIQVDSGYLASEGRVPLLHDYDDDNNIDQDMVEITFEDAEQQQIPEFQMIHNEFTPSGPTTTETNTSVDDSFVTTTQGEDEP